MTTPQIAGVSAELTGTFIAALALLRQYNKAPETCKYPVWLRQGRQSSRRRPAWRIVVDVEIDQMRGLF